MINEQQHFFGLDSSVWYFGVVEDRNDPLTLGRCKVRIFGVHPDDKTLVPTEDLPWAMPVQPITSAATAGVGTAPVGPIVGTHVVGFFADGYDRQIPFMLGTIAGGSQQFNYDSASQTGTDASGNPLPAPDLRSLTGVSGSVAQRGAKCAQILMNRYGIKDIHAAGFMGNLILESAGLQPIREGTMRNPDYTPWPKGTKGKGYGWAQWTNSRLDTFLDYVNTHHLQPQSDEAQLGYLLNELDGNVRGVKGSASLFSEMKNGFKGNTNYGYADCSTVEGSAIYVCAKFERPKISAAHVEQRQKYAKQVYDALKGMNVPVNSQGRK
jgi:hypothetical protein